MFLYLILFVSSGAADYLSLNVGRSTDNYSGMDTYHDSYGSSPREENVDFGLAGQAFSGSRRDRGQRRSNNSGGLRSSGGQTSFGGQRSSRGQSGGQSVDGTTVKSLYLECKVRIRL